MALGMVGEALISASVILIDKASGEFQDLFPNRKLNVSLLDELKTKLLAHNAVLIDAEEKQINDLAVKACLDELKNAVSCLRRKLEVMYLRLEYFVKQKDILGLQSVSRRVSFGTITDSLVESEVVSREVDKERLLNMLLSDDDDAMSNIRGVITISGMEGLGKTTIAQFLYNNSEVKK